MNNRGKNLSKLELLKNRLIYLTTLYPDSELDAASRRSLRDEINDAWKEVYHQLGRNELKPLNDDEFLRAHWIMRFMYSRRGGDDYINFLSNDYFSPKSIHKKVEKEVQIEQPEELVADYDFEEDEGDTVEEVRTVSVSSLSPTQIREYVNSLKASALHWFNSHYPFLAKELSEREKEYIDKLNRMNMGYFRPLIMSLLKNEISPARRWFVIQQTERFIFLVFHLSQAKRNYGDSEFYNAARELDQGKIKLKDIVDKLRNRLQYTLHKDGSFNAKYFNDYLYKKFNTASRGGFYNWHGLRYFLYEYELEKVKQSSQLKVTWDLFVRNEKDMVSIEHIFPQTNTEYWTEAFALVSSDKWYLYNGSLGNLLLLSASINSSLQNDSYPDKLEPKGATGERRLGYKNGSHSEIEVSLNYKQWTDVEIKNRGTFFIGIYGEKMEY